MKKIPVFDKILLLIYVLILISLFFIKTDGTLTSNNDYFSIVFRQTNIIPFQFLRNTPIISIVQNLLIKTLLLVPVSVFILKNKLYKNFQNFSFKVILIGIFVETFQVITIRGFFDTTDIFFYWIGCSIVYLFFKYQNSKTKEDIKL